MKTEEEHVILLSNTYDDLRRVLFLDANNIKPDL